MKKNHNMNNSSESFKPTFKPINKKFAFTLIELLVVIAMIAILLRSKWPFFLLFSAVFAFSRFDEKLLNTQIPNVTFRMILWFGIISWLMLYDYARIWLRSDFVFYLLILAYFSEMFSLFLESHVEDFWIYRIKFQNEGVNQFDESLWIEENSFRYDAAIKKLLCCLAIPYFPGDSAIIRKGLFCFLEWDVGE